MKHPLILCFISIFFFYACHKKTTPVTTIVEIQASNSLSPKELAILKDEMKSRLMNFSIENIDIQKHHENKQLVVKADVKFDNMDFYKSLFESNRLDLWDTFRTTDEIILNIKPSQLEVENFTPFTVLEPGFYPKEVLGICKEESQLEKIINLLSDNLQDIDNLKLIWSLEKGGGLDKTDYLLYMIDTKEQQEAPLTEKTITTASARPDNYSSSYSSIDFTFNEVGTKIWADMTKNAEKDDNRSIAIVLNDRLLTCPRVMSSIPSGNCTINSNFTKDQAMYLAKHFTISRLSYSLKVIEQFIQDDSSSNMSE